jgi:hypothetical protein
MPQSSRLMLLAAAALALAPAAALAQSAEPQAASPAPAASAAPSGMASPVAAPEPRPSAGGTITTSPAPASSPASSGSGSGASGSGSSGSGAGTNGNGGPSGHAAGKVKSIKSGSLSLSQVSYAVTHPLQAANQIKKMKTIDFDKLRVYKLPSSLKGALKLSDADTQAAALAVLGTGVQIAQTTGLPASNGNNSPIQYLRDVLANINVSNALNNLNVLNGSNVNVNVALSNVLNNNKISIGQVVGLYIGGGGIITTITK